MARSNMFTKFFGEAKKPEKEEKRKEKKIGKYTVQTNSLGSSGTEIYSGYSSEEYLQKLRDSEQADEFDKMRRNDPQVKMCLSAVKNPIKSARVEVVVESDDPKFDQHVELVKYNLFKGMKTPWSKFIREALTVIEFGNAPFEITHKNVMESPVGQHTGIADISWRSPKTIERFNVKHDGSLHSISQYAYGDLGRTVDIHEDFLMLMGLDVEGSNYEGVSLLRPCYGNWFRKQNYLKLNAIGVEKFAVPTPIATVPSGKEGTPEYDALLDALESYVSHDKNYLVKPEGWEIDLSTNTYDPSKVEASIDSEDKRMVKAFLANFLELGMSGSGSYALSNDLSDFFLGGIEYIADHIAENINNKIIKPLIEMNFGKQEVYPEIKFVGISDKAGEELANVLSRLAEKKFITPDDKLEENLRRRYRLPEMSDVGQREVDGQQGFFNLSEKIQARLKEDR